MDFLTNTFTNSTDSTNSIKNKLYKGFYPKSKEQTNKYLAPILNADGKYAKPFWYGSMVVLALIVLVVSFVISRKKATWRCNPKDDDDVKNLRQKHRGTLASIMAALGFAVLQLVMEKYGDIHTNALKLFSVLFGGTIYFLANQGMGTDQGYRVFKEHGFEASMDYIFGTLYSGKYMRCGITLMLDLFIASMIFVKLYSWIRVNSSFLEANESLGKGLCAAVISMITFQAYANQIRYLWAYPDPKSKSKVTWMKSSTVFTFTTVTAITYMLVDTGDEGFSSNLKMFLTMLTLCTLTALSAFNLVDPHLEYEVDTVHCSADVIEKAEQIVESIKACRGSDPTQDQKTGCTYIKRLASESINYKTWDKETDQTTVCYGATEDDIRLNLVRNLSQSTEEILSRSVKGRVFFVVIAVVVSGSMHIVSDSATRIRRKWVLLAFVALAYLFAFGPLMKKVVQNLQAGNHWSDALSENPHAKTLRTKERQQTHTRVEDHTTNATIILPKIMEEIESLKKQVEAAQEMQIKTAQEKPQSPLPKLGEGDQDVQTGRADKHLTLSDRDERVVTDHRVPQRQQLDSAKPRAAAM